MRKRRSGGGEARPSQEDLSSRSVRPLGSVRPHRPNGPHVLSSLFTLLSIYILSFKLKKKLQFEADVSSFLSRKASETQTCATETTLTADWSASL